MSQTDNTLDKECKGCGKNTLVNGACNNCGYMENLDNPKQSKQNSQNGLHSEKDVNKNSDNTPGKDQKDFIGNCFLEYQQGDGMALTRAWNYIESLIADDRKKMLDEIDDIAEGLSIPSITTWRQGRFIDSPKYYKMGDKWRHEQEEREKTLIRPYGGTNNALFQVSGYVDNEVIAEYLEAVGKVLRQRAKEWSKRND